MAINLSNNEKTIAQAWLHDVFVWGGLASAPKRPIPVNRYRYMYGTDPENFRQENDEYRKAAVEVCNMIKQRVVETQHFKKYNDALNLLSRCYFTPDINSTNIHGHVQKTAPELATYVAWFCASHEFYWDNRNTTKYEMAEIKNTVLGQALYIGNCFVKQKDPDEKKPEEQTAAKADKAPAKQDTPAPASQPAQQGDTGKQPKNPFKARGPLSNVAVDLIGTPGHKTALSGDIFCINAIDQTTNKALEDCAYIRPVEDKNQDKYKIGNTNKLLFGKAKGYGYCQIYWQNKADADNYLKSVNWSDLTSMYVGVAKKKANSNGYFAIGTQYGPAYISAEKLNEELEEEVITEKKSSISNKEKWERLENAFNRDL